jgi:TldD protein
MSEAHQEGLQYFSQFGVDERLLREAIACALERGGSWADLFFEHGTSQSISLQDGAVNAASSGVSLGVGVRVVSGVQTGYAYSEDLTREAVLNAARSAALIAEGAPQAQAPLGFNATPHASRYPIEQPWMSVSVEQKIPLLQRLNSEAFDADPRIKKVTVGMSHSDSVIWLVESNGATHFDRQPMTRLSMQLSAEQGEGPNKRRESNGANYAARGGFELVTDERLTTLREKAVQRTLFLFDAEIAPLAGEYPVVLGAGASAILLHEAIGHGMEADFNRKDISIYSERVNKRIAPKGVTIIDDGTREGDRGAINFDDEGVDGQRTVLVEDGILRSYMHDRISATHYGVAPTGNGRRESFRHAPVPRMRNTYMTAGEHDPEDIIRSVKRGVYAESFTNGQVMIGAGDFTFYIKTGYLIEDGKLTRPIKDTNIIGNGPEVLERTDMVGHDFKFDDGGWVCGKDGQSVPVSLGMPTVRVSSVTIGGVSQGGEQ